MADEHEESTGRFSKWKDKAAELAGKANDALEERRAVKATEQNEDLDTPIGEWHQSRFSNTVHPERLVLYPNRVEYAEQGMVRKSSASVSFDQLAQVRIDSGMRHATLIIESSGGQSLSIEKMPKGEANDARTAILAAAETWRARRSAPGAPAPSSGGVSQAGELERIADLHERGLLTDEEFTAAKAKLLG